MNPLDSVLSTPIDFTVLTGYIHPAYAESFSEFGSPRLLPRSGGWIVERKIPHSNHSDAMGCYPIFVCQDWSQVNVDLESIGDELVSVAVVTDPFGEYDHDWLSKCFPDVSIRFKEHFVVDLSREPSSFLHSHHRRNTVKALRQISVEECTDPARFLEDWVTLYETLKDRHAITGITAFSRRAFAAQLNVPGLVMLRAIHNNETVGILLWYVQNNRAYYHLGAYNSAGYELGASFALFDYAIKCFAERGLAWLSLGSGAGVGASGEGLRRFKEGWSTGVRMAYFCGRILNRAAYQRIWENRGLPPTTYFPAYRVGEFS